ANGTASISTAALSAAAHTINAIYTDTLPDTNFAASSAVALNGYVVAATATTITSFTVSPVSGSNVFGQPVTLVATVSSTTAGIPNAGRVTFWDGPVGSGINLGSGNVNVATGQASITTTALSAATHTINAVYADMLPDTNFATSPIVSLSGYVVS